MRGGRQCTKLSPLPSSSSKEVVQAHTPGTQQSSPVTPCPRRTPLLHSSAQQAGENQAAAAAPMQAQAARDVRAGWHGTNRRSPPLPPCSRPWPRPPSCPLSLWPSPRTPLYPASPRSTQRPLRRPCCKPPEFYPSWHHQNCPLPALACSTPAALLSCNPQLDTGRGAVWGR